MLSIDNGLTQGDLLEPNRKASIDFTALGIPRSLQVPDGNVSYCDFWGR
jgi:hypothetical protein